MAENNSRLTPEELAALTQGLSDTSGAEEIEARPVEFAELTGPAVPRPGQTAGVDFLWDVPMDVEVVLGTSALAVHDVLEMGPGSVVELDRAYGEPVDVFLNGRIVARGEVVIVGEQFGVKITEILASVKEMAGPEPGPSNH
ncbi:MAG: flagellar motor switch protein FliN [Sulfobacillus thermosulfidooxidans]|uniref:Flagellar motor switch protein FliN n=1 Tax=Sulfobacillus thermotolerans TaxID=338644 RepID=A0ABN5H4X1_9FIRM|nr:flagellar motor switch protein FliN [Sulfobacillus sp. hq2]AUW94959.1 flagellar motor switch protein FliN [Sulfobacillus thermotolerans]POB10439.1 flagellar motor switch protein FliN [Sulfobacillus sp. hq2]PSR36610.1 MAG: flagellar motor switch protein FliN [Sulfobacillus thermosulfidooxidans]